MRARPSIVAPAIRADELDVLVYPELGMDACSFALAALRLAPRQYAGWGHPVTTGHPTIDAFVSCDVMEPQGAEAHYTEALVKLPGIGTRYEPLTIPDDASRARFGLPEDRKLLLCPQSLWKIHPDNDALFAEILAANPNALLVLFEGRYPAVGERFMRRLTRVLGEHGVSVPERIRVLPQVGHDDSCATRCWTRCTGREATRVSTRSPAACRWSRSPERSCADGRARACCNCWG